MLEAGTVSNAATGETEARKTRHNRKDTMSGIYLVAAIVLALVMPAKAQFLDMPKTIKVHNNKTGEIIGTITMSGATAYVRNKDCEHVYTVVRNPDGTTTSFDPHGNAVAAPKLSE